ncbi:hypothetical protein TMUPMC115_0221 [Tetragenococcus muriaticus PMC-11-5]|uniref:Uncharacterized protein n=1 Tax=Tetragenococcus muriaticus PMC-11-5 TaxID=1302649 RepID=A0A091CFQ8_9ENTE|nr:hypothetical protein [Tetragenococcus muriaticus]KFN93623.1 hypothetical protein TMUPMC115_0221 [Tetragenococcus muriaticus PMC-11-5]
MSRINVSINAETAEELQELLKELSGSEINLADPHNQVPAKKEEPEKETKSEPEKKEKPKTSKKKKATKKATASTEKISDTEKEEKPKEDEPEEKSKTDGKHPDATKADVQAAMKEAMDNGHRDKVLAAFDRFNAKKLSDLNEEDYSAFLTDLEVLAGE